MNGKSIDERIKWLLNLNKVHSDEFMASRLSRQLYRVKHPTEICAFKCMDGRIHVPLVTNTPLGIIRPYRNIGGYFKVGWPLLGEDLQKWVEYGISRGRKSLILITYHFSKGDTHRGCAGFNYDQQAAFNFTIEFNKRVNQMFGKNNNVVYPIVVGLETDTDALIFHPQDPTGGNILTVTGDMSQKEDYLIEVINGLYPDMDITVKNDLLPLIQGNIAHIQQVKNSNRELVDMQHREWVLGIGRGFDWLHEPNTALIIGPFSPDLSKPIIKALSIISDNMKSGRTNDDGFLVLCSAPYREIGTDKNRAMQKADFFREYVRDIIKDNFPELLEKAKVIAVIVDENTRLIEEVPEEI